MCVDLQQSRTEGLAAVVLIAGDASPCAMILPVLL
jgi:hypothetical protein